jgi:hypothetical protein
VVPALHVARPRRERGAHQTRPGRRPTVWLTVDVPVAGSRLRDVHNGLVFPPRPTLRTLGDMACTRRGGPMCSPRACLRLAEVAADHRRAWPACSTPR